MGFVRAASLTEVPSGNARRVEVDGRPVLLANVEGELFAIADRCTHLGGTLSKGTYEGGVVTCPRHGAQFDVRTGRNLRAPRILFFRGKATDARSYPVRLEGDDVLVDVDG